MQRIPFNKPYIVGNEIENISKSINDHLWIAGNGHFTQHCHEWLEEHLNCRKVLLTHSGTAALEMAALLLDLQPGDEFILPSYTFVSTANAFILRGAKPVFVDIRPDTLNIDADRIREAVTPKTKVIVPVHYAGVACDMDMINTIAADFNLHVVEDAAQGIFSQYKNQQLGTIGEFGILSFHETKNIISGEGGALLVNNPDFIERAEIIWEKGTNRKQFFQGLVDKYTWLDVGSSFLPSELIAAFLYTQLENATAITDKRERIYHYYRQNLVSLEQKGLLELPTIPADCKHNYHMFYIVTHDSDQRTRLLKFLNDNGINAVFHYVPLHLSPMGQHYGYKQGDFPITEGLASRIIRLPCFFEITLAEQDSVIQKINEFYSP